MQKANINGKGNLQVIGNYTINIYISYNNNGIRRKKQYFVNTKSKGGSR